MQRVLNEAELEIIYNWVDEIPLTRPKRNMAKDFADAVLMAEIIAYFNPKIVELHNYIPTGSLAQKINNWKILNDKVLKKLKVILTKEDIENLANGVPNQIQKLLFLLRKTLTEEGPSPTTTSKVSKISKVSRMTLGIGEKKKQKKQYSFKEIKRMKQVADLLQNKDKCVQILKEQVEILALKFTKLQEIIKSKDRQIEELVKKIKSKGLA